MRSSSIIMFSLVLLLLASAASAAVLPTRAIVHDCPSDKFPSQSGMTVVKPPSDGEGLRFTGDTLKLVSIAIEWLELPTVRASTYPVDTLGKILFSHDEMPCGSVADYFEEVSYGALHVTGDIYGWVNGGSYGASLEDLLAALEELDPTVDFTQYDGDNDGFIDGVVFWIAGTGLQDTQCSTDL